MIIFVVDYGAPIGFSGSSSGRTPTKPNVSSDIPEEGSPEAEANEKEIDSSKQWEQFDSLADLAEYLDIFGDLDELNAPTGPPAPKQEPTFAEVQQCLKSLKALMGDASVPTTEIAKNLGTVFLELNRDLTSGIPISGHKLEEVKISAAYLIFWLSVLANELKFDLGEAVRHEQDYLSSNCE